MFAALDWFLIYGDLHEGQLDCWQLSDCMFVERFGPFEIGEKFAIVSLDLVEGILKAWSDDGQTVVKECRIAIASMEPTVEPLQ